MAKLCLVCVQERRRPTQVDYFLLSGVVGSWWIQLFGAINDPQSKRSVGLFYRIEFGDEERMFTCDPTFVRIAVCTVYLRTIEQDFSCF